MAGERKGIPHSLYVRFGIRMMLAVAGAVLLFLVLQSVGRIALDFYFSHSGYVRKENYRRLKNLQSYIREIQILETGSLEYEITVRGRDELASMARGLEGMRKSLREQMERKEEAVRLNGKLVTEVSHELRTPLTAIKVYVEVLQGNRNKDSEVKYLDKISAKVQELNDLADRISEQGGGGDKAADVLKKSGNN